MTYNALSDSWQKSRHFDKKNRWVGKCSAIERKRKEIIWTSSTVAVIVMSSTRKLIIFNTNLLCEENTTGGYWLTKQVLDVAADYTNWLVILKVKENKAKKRDALDSTPNKCLSEIAQDPSTFDNYRQHLLLAFYHHLQYEHRTIKVAKSKIKFWSNLW